MTGPAGWGSLDGHTFVPVAQVEGGEVGIGTVFHYRQDGDLVETWRWESREGAGTSIVEERLPDGA